LCLPTYVRTYVIDALCLSFSIALSLSLSLVFGTCLEMLASTAAPRFINNNRIHYNQLHIHLHCAQILPYRHSHYSRLLIASHRLYVFIKRDMEQVTARAVCPPNWETTQIFCCWAILSCPSRVHVVLIELKVWY
jgi:hypothetical protein